MDKGQVEQRLIPNLNTFADLIDRLIVEVNKLAYFENNKREAHKDAEADPGSFDRNLIAFWDNKSRDACEYRSMLKNAINEQLTKVCESGEYKTLKELRTFAPPGKNVEDLLAAKCLLAPNFIKQMINDRS